AYLGFQALRTGIEATDNYTNQNSRLALINDGLQTQAELQNKIYQAAQRSRGAYGETVSSVAKLGLLAKDAFSSNNETIAFAELMNKSFKISGASISESTNGMYQLTQAMAAGRLQGDEFRSVMENAPMLAQAIAKYTGKSMGELRKMSSEGEITANIIKNSLFSMADDINKKFATMPMTFETAWTRIKNQTVATF
ncbi:tail tape measure protein, partial [Hafnia paralvei]|uniref:tape measure protein n=1 Tax=Hafnia paralvei TaxID=546367 RepID=UPI000DFE73DD